MGHNISVLTTDDPCGICDRFGFARLHRPRLECAKEHRRGVGQPGDAMPGVSWRLFWLLEKSDPNGCEIMVNYYYSGKLYMDVYGSQLLYKILSHDIINIMQNSSE